MYVFDTLPSRLHPFSDDDILLFFPLPFLFCFAWLAIALHKPVSAAGGQ